MKTDGDSKRKLSERKDPGASAGCSLEQGFPAGAIQYHLRGLANGRLAETPPDQALASAPIPQFRWPGHPRASQGGSGPIQGRPGAGRRQSMPSGVPEGGPGTRSNSCITRRSRTGKKTAQLWLRGWLRHRNRRADQVVVWLPGQQPGGESVSGCASNPCLRYLKR